MFPTAMWTTKQKARIKELLDHPPSTPGSRARVCGTHADCIAEGSLESLVVEKLKAEGLIVRPRDSSFWEDTATSDETAEKGAAVSLCIAIPTVFSTPRPGAQVPRAQRDRAYRSPRFVAIASLEEREV